MLSATASRDKEGKIHISMSNVDLQNAQEVTISLQGANVKKVSGEILTSAKISDHNTFDLPDKVKPAVFNGASISGNVLTVKIPAKSIITLELW
jgi:alpha-N-arabinofuranosidase